MWNDVGRMVEFVVGDSTRFGVVTGESKNKLQVTDQNGRQHSVPLRNVLIRHDEKADVSQVTQLADQLRQRITHYEEQIDSELLWHTVVSEAEEFDGHQLCRIYFGETGCCRESALLRAVSGDSLRFRLRNGRIQPRSAVQVEEQLHALHRQEEKESQRKTIRAWFREILAGSQTTPEAEVPNAETVLRRLEDFLLQRQRDEEVPNWLEALEPELTTRMAAYEILAALERLPPSADPLLMAAGIDPRFSREAVERAAALSPYLPASRDRMLRGAITVAIDDEDTREIDDAVSIEPTSRGLRVAIHIADVGHFVVAGDLLDQEDRRRVSSVYLPQTTVRMLPETLSCELASLQAGTARPVLTLVADFDHEGNLSDWKFAVAEAEVSRNMSYEEADRMIRSPEGDDLSALLCLLESVTEGLRRERLRDGAIMINRPEVKIVVRKDTVRLKVLDRESPSRRMIGELMILTNRLAADFAVTEALPVIFRTQAPPAEPIELPEEYDPVQVNQAFTRLERSRLSIEPGRHAGLGVERYTQVTSPIRRYSDLLVQRQLEARLSGASPPYQPEGLAEAIGLIQQLDGEIRSAERTANRFYTLTFLHEQCRDSAVPAVVLRALDRGYLVETQDTFARGLLIHEAGLSPGTCLDLKIDQVVPARNILTFRTA